MPETATAHAPITFAEHVAPIIFQNCSSCHRPGESAPFSLLSYEDVRKRARQIVEVTEARIMPPWLPDPSVNRFVGERHLAPQQITVLKQWHEAGAPEGDPQRIPRLPKWNDSWELGRPDLVVKPRDPYRLAAEGRDIYRNLVLPIPIDRMRFVRAIEFRPNSRAVHHAFMRFDRTGATRRLDGKDGAPGFSGLHTPRTAESPTSQFASWQPGKRPSVAPEDSVWPLGTNTDLVLQLHLQPIGREELVQPELAFYFTDKPPTAISYKIPLTSLQIEIPAGSTRTTIEDSYVLPVDVEVRAILPHAHYLARSIECLAVLPDGAQRRLLSIPSWDFNWQGDYRYVEPVRLPKGAALHMRFTYDNSAANPRNPIQPPQLVRYGLQSTDEMAEVWLQVVLKSESDLQTLTRDMQPRVLRNGIVYHQYLLRLDPNDASAHQGLGAAFYFSGRTSDALIHLRKAIELAPGSDEAHYFLGLAYRSQNLLPAAATEFLRAVALNPRHANAHGNLGLILAQQGRLAEAAAHFERALELNPADRIARDMLEQIRKQRR